VRTSRRPRDCPRRPSTTPLSAPADVRRRRRDGWS
jgi:hypothetical protein